MLMGRPSLSPPTHLCLVRGTGWARRTSHQRHAHTLCTWRSCGAAMPALLICHLRLTPRESCLQSSRATLPFWWGRLTLPFPSCQRDPGWGPGYAGTFKIPIWHQPVILAIPLVLTAHHSLEHDPLWRWILWMFLITFLSPCTHPHLRYWGFLHYTSIAELFSSPFFPFLPHQGVVLFWIHLSFTLVFLCSNFGYRFPLIYP